MLKNTLITILCAITLVPAYSQSWDEVTRNTDIYLFGEGIGATVEEADQQALRDLISKISVSVSSNFSITEDERTVNGQLDATSYTNSKLQTYSSATLNNTERIVIDNSPDEAHIGRYIKRSELDRIFEGRIRTLKEHVRLGAVAEEACKIDDALRNYYWAYALLKSVQRPAEVTYTDEDSDQELHLLTYLPEKIKTILGSLDIQVTGKDDENVDLMFTYNGKPVGSLDFTYFDGRNWSNLASVKNGRGTMEFASGMIPENVSINYEYAYRGQAHINQEIKSVLDVVKGGAIKGARVNVKIPQTPAPKPVTVAQTPQTPKSPQTSQSETVNIAPVANEDYYRTAIDKVVNAIKTHQYSSVMKYFSADGKDMFQRLIMYGNARVLNTTECEFYQFYDNVVARSIQMSFTFKHGIRSNFVEDVVFTFGSDSLIDCIAFGLDKKAKDDIMGKNVWPKEARMALMEFLENYKTAYALKRLDYIRTIFDDDAVIIVGHIVKKLDSNGGDVRTYHNNQYVQMTQYSKEQYLKQLENCFRSNEFINIRFANNDVRKAKDGQEYGIQIKQDYYSTNYGDEGYLYLQVDLNNRKEPIIHVRTWQPEPDPEVGLFGMGDF